MFWWQLWFDTWFGPARPPKVVYTRKENVIYCSFRR
jgi:hypothetical protein